MHKSRSKCFVSYCHLNADNESISALINLIRETAGKDYEILFDDDMKVGDNIDDFISMLNDVDAVIILFTKEYNTKISNRQNYVYKEYSIISQRLNDFSRKKDEGRKTGEIDHYFELIPILFAGDAEASMPTELAMYRYLDFREFRSRNNHINDHVKSKYIKHVREIIDKLTVINTLKSNKYKQLYDEYYRRLFVERKADWKNGRDDALNYINTLFVKTYAYKKLSSQSAYFIIGRKGSGKSTIAEVLTIKHKSKYCRGPW